MLWSELNYRAKTKVKELKFIYSLSPLSLSPCFSHFNYYLLIFSTWNNIAAQFAAILYLRIKENAYSAVIQRVYLVSWDEMVFVVFG